MEANWADDDVTRCHTFFAVMHLPLLSIGKVYTLSFDKLVCRIIKERLSACHMATVTEIILISVFHALH